MRRVKLLRRFLYYQAAVWAACGLSIALLPGPILRAFDQRAVSDPTFFRIGGVLSVALALLMILVAQRLDDVWWWSWTFAITDAALATVAALHALFDLPRSSGALLWWLIVAGNLAFGVGVLAGMARAGQENPFV